MVKHSHREHREKLAAFRRGKKSSEETKRKQSLALMGRMFSPESIAKQQATFRAKKELLCPTYHDCRKPIVAVGSDGGILHVFESLLEASDGLETPNSSLRYYLMTGRVTPKGMLLYYATIVRDELLSQSANTAVLM